MRRLLNHKIIGLRIEFAHEDNNSWNKLDWLAMKWKLLAAHVYAWIVLDNLNEFYIS